MVGTYHRAGVSRWVPVLKPLAELVGRRLQIRVAVSEAARETGIPAGGGEFEVLFNGVDMERFESAAPVHHEEGPPVVLFLGRHEERKGLNVLLDAFARIERPAILWVAGDGPGGEVQRRRYPESERVRWLGMLSDADVAARLAEADILCAPSLRGESFGMVLLEGMAAGCAVVESDLEGYRSAAGGHQSWCHPEMWARWPVPSGRRWPTRARGAVGPPPRHARRGSSTRAPGRWTRSPSATSTCTGGRSPPTGAEAPPAGAEPRPGGRATARVRELDLNRPPRCDAPEEVPTG